MEESAMRLLSILVVMIAFAWAAPQSQELKPPAADAKPTPADWNVPPEEAKRENPVKPTEASIAQGKKLFGYQCAMCHGEKGDGKGDLAATMQLTLIDYTQPDSLKDWTDGMLFYAIEKGKGKMPGQEGRMKDQQQWNLVNYIRSLARKQDKATPAKPEEP
jgi:mono/diheme cytochrome c family protein